MLQLRVCEPAFAEASLLSLSKVPKNTFAAYAAAGGLFCQYKMMGKTEKEQPLAHGYSSEST